MPFSSVNFLATLPLLLVVYWALPRTWRRGWLIVASVIVYMSAGWRDLCLLLVVTSLNWLSHVGAPKNKPVRVAMIVFNVAILAWFKYRLFLGVNPDGLTKLIIPLGLSFYAFQLISYQVEIIQGLVTEPPTFLSFLLYIFFFPHHQAGPIMRPHVFIRSFLEGRTWRAGRFKIGLVIALWGLFKKIWLADFLLSNWVGYLYGNLEATHGARGSAFLLAVAYGAQIYLDFSGYSDIAVGVGRMFGFKLDRNFHQPYLASGPSEFWRRWHVTLSRWLRDYVYIPLGGNRHGTARTKINLMLVMLIGGLWHGAQWTFVFWGFLHGAYLILEQLTDGVMKRVPAVKYLIFQALIMLAWLPFRSSSPSDLLNMITRPDAWLTPDTFIAAVLFAAVAFFSKLEDSLERNFTSLVGTLVAAPDLALAVSTAAAALLLVAGIKYEVMFIYQRF